MIFRPFLTLTFVIVSSVSMIAQAQSENFIFRYKSTVVPTSVEGPENPVSPIDPEEQDVTARLFGIVGETFHSSIPTTAGNPVEEWEILSGILPEGLLFDAERGLISGVPSEIVHDRILIARGHRDAEAAASASIYIEIVEPTPAAVQQEIHVRTNQVAYHWIDDGGADVYEWENALPLPGWMSFNDGQMIFTPPEAGVWPFAFKGRDALGYDVAFSYGHIFAEDGLSLSFNDLADQEHGTTVVSNIVPIRGLMGSAEVHLTDENGDVGSIGDFAFRICSDSTCADIHHEWRSEGISIANGQFIQLRMLVPDGSLETETVHVTVTEGAMSAAWDWNVTSMFKSEMGYTRVSAGSGHTCGIKTDGSAWCWGLGSKGQLGNGETNSSLTPIPVSGGHTFMEITAGADHTCGIRTDGSVWCWGDNGSDQLGTQEVSNFSTVPVPATGNHIFSKIVTTFRHVCGITVEGTALCWGSNGYGQLGIGREGVVPHEIKPKSGPVPTIVSGGHVFADIAVGYDLTCGVKTDGSLWCWGRGTIQSYGNGSVDGEGFPGPNGGPDGLIPIHVTDENNNVAVEMPFMRPNYEVKKAGGLFSARGLGANNALIALGDSFSCGLDVYGTSRCDGTYGTGLHADRRETFPDLAFESIEAGRQHVCGIEADGSIWCWGVGTNGQLGNGATSNSITPVRIASTL